MLKDGDSIPDYVDNCPEIPNAEQKDIDHDGKGDECDDDSDDDGILDTKDNCPLVKNPSQDDVDGNHRGDLCELDLDMDETIDRLDNCPENTFINRTSFVRHTVVDFIPTWTTEPAPIWRVLDNGMEIRQDRKTRKAVALIGMCQIFTCTF
ncbi:cartilage oligomeric matrix protein-like [Gigantopelta aegis]|uniref:cartilage oligomeric matrix protein-like n=1 Tax=Gigantopelta aegis TaxID=1735272 RepID=UPI001B88B8C0|nr:cartilage oligomeric matrix protein-like [Gigantopelta aegis]